MSTVYAHNIAPSLVLQYSPSIIGQLTEIDLCRRPSFPALLHPRPRPVLVRLWVQHDGQHCVAESGGHGHGGHPRGCGEGIWRPLSRGDIGDSHLEGGCQNGRVTYVAWLFVPEEACSCFPWRYSSAVLEQEARSQHGGTQFRL